MRSTKIEMVCDRCSRTDLLCVNETHSYAWGTISILRDNDPKGSLTAKDLCPECLMKVRTWYRTPAADAAIIKAK